MPVVYNEIEPYAIDWLRNLSGANLIARGTVLTSSIKHLTKGDFANVTQAHFFAGIGVWSHALRSAGWSDGLEVWTGSCPCQPFSQAGRGGGTDDERHLWPEWFRLIRQCRPPVIFGEQVASPAGLGWLDAVQADLESEGYAVGAADLCAASVGAPHIRQRIYFTGIRQDVLDHASRQGSRRNARAVPSAQGEGAGQRREPGHLTNLSLSPNATSTLADDDDERFREQRLAQLPEDSHPSSRHDVNGRSTHGGARAVANTDIPHPLHGTQPRSWRLVQPAPHATSGFWSPADWIPCTDGKARPVEPCTFPLAHGATARVGRLRAYGNAIVAPLAVEFIKAVMDVLDAS